MKRLYLLVEGQTEETFVRDVLSAHLLAFDIASIAVVLKTKRKKEGGHYRGGVVSTEQVLGDIQRLLGDTSAAMVTTIVDYYGLPADFPGMSARVPGPPAQRVGGVEAAFAEAVGNKRFLPHLVLHEFEAWLFSDPTEATWVFDDDPSVPSQLTGIAITKGGPELIDEGRETAPSKRIKEVFGAYEKPFHGPIAAGAIGLGKIRNACPHMAAWLSSLEAL